MMPIDHLDLTGFEGISDQLWRNPHGVEVTVQFIDEPPDLSVSLDEVRTIQRALGLATLCEGLNLVEVWVDYPGDLPAIYRMVKGVPPGWLAVSYVATYLVPRATCAVQIQISAEAGPLDEHRKRFAVDRLGWNAQYIPGPGHEQIRDRNGRMPYDPADAHGFDDIFPGHGLSRLRVALRQIYPSVTYTDWFRALPPFEPPQQVTTRRWRFGRRIDP